MQGGSASVAISIHGSQAIAYICNDGKVEGWLKGTVTHGPLVLTGKNQRRSSYRPGVAAIVQA